jgi:hypothetical protein
VEEHRACLTHLLDHSVTGLTETDVRRCLGARM